jgi:hypothetical protein
MPEAQTLNMPETQILDMPETQINSKVIKGHWSKQNKGPK